MRHASSILHHVIAFDIGGTSLRAGIVTPHGTLLSAPLRRDTPNIWTHRGEPIRHVQARLIELIVRTVRELQQRHPRLALRHAGIAMAGSITARGVVRHSSGLWGDRGHQFPLLARLRRRLRLRWLVVNDMTAAAAYYGGLRVYQRDRWIAVITVSSGVGGKICDTQLGEVLLDPEGISGELGHVRVDMSPTAARCECGVRGHVQALCSGRAAERLARQLARRSPQRFRGSRLWRMTRGQAQRTTTFQLAAAARARDAFALDVLQRVTAPLAQAIALLVGSIGIGRVIITGGFALGVGQPYVQALQRHLLAIGCCGRTPAATRRLVCLGRRGDIHGLIGAGLLAQHATND